MPQPFQLLALAFAILTRPFVHAQFPPPAQYTTALASNIDPAVTIKYREPDAGTCSTVYGSQRQYTGYITLPPFTLAPIQQNYTINTFFWFIEARRNPDTAPLTVWLNGGPGSSSLFGLFTENGPCEVIQTSDGSYGTQSRLWGWDRISNMLYIDQPDQVGLSYDVATDQSYNLVNQSFSPPASVPIGQPTWSFLNGTFSSNNPDATANTTQIAASAVWHFLQTWLSTFPTYNPGIRGNSSAVVATGVNLFTESYGGLYAPIFADLFEAKNALREADPVAANTSLEIKLTSVGIVNGIVDFKLQAPYYATYAYNNTYGIRPNSYDQNQMNTVLTDLNAPGGCLDQITQCQALVSTLDPAGDGDVPAVNAKCSSAYSTSCQSVQRLFDASGRSVYDIRQKSPDPFPSQAYVEYLNTAQVQAAIGTPINFTSSTMITYNSFASTGDQIRTSQIAALSRLLSQGIHVALLYGDADFICNWQGGEAVSFALASLLPTYANFSSAGYADIVVNDSYVGGTVRQFGNLSFSRIYDAGHFVPAYQPETAFQVFARIISGTAVSTGEIIDPSVYNTSGSATSTKSNKQGSSKPSICWIRNIPGPQGCTNSQKNGILGNSGVVYNGIWYASAEDYTPPSPSVTAGKPGIPGPNRTSFSKVNGSPSVAPTGVYVATSTPRHSMGNKMDKSLRFGAYAWVVGLVWHASVVAFGMDLAFT
ncbi:hypothetical protein FKW77_008467 [Venturia effusa]|uniref:Carboxypeptidase n=1 Tax=Venturia effusa TaxID=50376 RepID=A0A517LHR0_9PEZI|nr:hypothetical protein FKW77_008467 [Venturia effusa]